MSEIYKCPRCGAKAFSAIVYEDDKATCANCKYVGSLYEVPMDDWPVIEFLRKK